MCMAEFWRCKVVLKFSPTLLVGGDKHHLIRWSVVTLVVLVENRRLSPAHSSSAAVRPSRHDTPRVAGMSRADAYVFAVQENRVASVRVQLSQFGSLPDRGLLHRLERVRRGRPTLYPLGFPEPHYILPCTACAVTHPNQSRFCQSRALRRHRSLLHPVRRRAPANGTAGLRNRSSL